jgi:heme exporter protein B
MRTWEVPKACLATNGDLVEDKKNMNLFFKTLQREYLLISRKPMQFCMPLLFFSVVCTIIPLSISPNNPVLTQIGPGIIWIAILLSALLTLPHLFADDYDDGTLDQWIIQPHQFTKIIITRLLCHWFFTLLPMILLAPVFAQLFHLSIYAIEIMVCILFIGTPLVLIQGAIVAAVCVRLRKEALLLAIILLPLYIPTLIFGTTSIDAAQQGLPVLFQVNLMSALTILALAFGPTVIAMALRVGITYG